MTNLTPNELVNRMLENYNKVSIEQDSIWRRDYLIGIREVIRSYEKHNYIFPEERRILSNLENKLKEIKK